MSSKYEIGVQPVCESYSPEREGSPTERECPRCGSRVSFCLECGFDHHAWGWDTCRQRLNTTPEPQQ